MEPFRLLRLLSTYLLLHLISVTALSPLIRSNQGRQLSSVTVLFSTTDPVANDTPPPEDVKAEWAGWTSIPAEAIELKRKLLVLANKTDRGFKATNQDRKEARELIFQLARFNPTEEPLKAYYEGNRAVQGSTEDSQASVIGKWTLRYTDAPDITSLQDNALAQLGRVGQECQPPFIKNVIEWKRPSWAASLPLSGTEGSRVLQKVVTQATASPAEPTVAKLDIAGLEVETDGDTRSGSLQESIQNNGLVSGLLSNQPVNLKGPLTLPFGEFEVLYLDDELRIIKTGQNYLAMNTRVSQEDEWF